MFRGIWFWTGNIDQAIQLAKDTGANTMILKAGYQQPLYSTNVMRRNDFPTNARKCREAGLLVAAEMYNIPEAWQAEAILLRDAIILNGASSVVLNMESPYEEEVNVLKTSLLCNALHPYPVWACTDFRGSRLTLPYHKELGRWVRGWMPMIYPGAFYPSTEGGVQRSFDDVYGSWNQYKGILPLRAQNLPVLPTIQSYGGMSYEKVLAQIILSWQFTRSINGTHGTSLYASHDTNDRAKWGARDGWQVVEAATNPAPQPPTHQPFDEPIISAAATAAATAAAEAVRRFFGGA